MLHHVSLEVLPDDAERFAELLGAIGFEAVEAPEALGGAVHWFGRAGTQVHLILTERATASALGHAAFAVDDFAATVEASASATSRSRRRESSGANGGRSYLPQAATGSS